MPYRHFDLAEVERQMRKVHESGLLARLENAKTDTERQGYQLQARAFEAQIAINMQVFAMINEGVSDEIIAKTIGAIVTNVFVNTVAASEQPALTFDIIFAILTNGFKTVSGGGDGSIHYTTTTLAPVRGGRA